MEKETQLLALIQALDQKIKIWKLNRQPLIKRQLAAANTLTSALLQKPNQAHALANYTVFKTHPQATNRK